MLSSNPSKNLDSISDHNARLLEKYRISFNSIEHINFTNRTLSISIILKGSSHTLEEWLTTEDPAKRAGFQAAAAYYVPEALYFLERLLPYMMEMRQLLPSLQEEDRIWSVLNTEMSTLDVSQCEETLAEKENNLKLIKNTLSPSELKKYQAEIRSLKDLVQLKKDHVETAKRLVKNIHQLQLDSMSILNQAYILLLELWNGSLREHCPLPLNRSKTAISDVKNSNIEQLINEIEDLLHNSAVRRKKPLFGRETDTTSFFNDTHKRTLTLSQPIALDEQTELTDPVELSLKIQQKQICLLDGFNKVLKTVVYNAVGDEGIKQCERYEADYEQGAKKWQNSKELPGLIQVNDNHVAIIAKWIYKNVGTMHNTLISQEQLKKKSSFFDFLTRKPSLNTSSVPLTPRVNKSVSYSQNELAEINKLENKIAPIAEELMRSQLPLTPKEREKYAEMLSKFSSLVKLRPEYETLQKEINDLLAPPETTSKVMEKSPIVREESLQEESVDHDANHGAIF